MPLRVVPGGECDKPIIVCDHCGEPIADVDDGNYHWRFDGRGDYPGAAVYFTHKKCCYAFERTNPGSWGALTLIHLFAFLGNGLELDWEAAQFKAELLDSSDD
jgi:hypothetical protein